MFAPATRDIFIELPLEDAEPGMVGKLEKSLYGTRDSALNWAEAYTKVLIPIGCKRVCPALVVVSTMRTGTSALSCTATNSSARGQRIV